MINIAIIDDDKRFLDIIKDNIITAVQSFSREVCISCYLKADEVLNELKSGKNFHIIFSDIQMDELNGLKFGEIVREKYSNIYFIFITSYPEYAAKSYSINAYQYILKEELSLRIKCVLDPIFERIYKERKEYHTLKVHNDFRKIFFKDIIYIKKMKSGKYIQIFTMDEELRERIPLERIMQQLDEREFVMIERGYIVNIRHIVRMKGNTIFLKNGDEVVISRARFSKVKQIISDIWSNDNEYNI